MGGDEQEGGAPGWAPPAEHGSAEGWGPPAPPPWSGPPAPWSWPTGDPQHPAPPVPAKANRRAVVAALSIPVLLVACLVGLVLQSSGGRHALARARVAIGQLQPPCPGVTPTDANLSGLTFTPPAGTHASAGTELVDLDTAASFSANPSELRRVLIAEAFEGGARKMWTDATAGLTVDVRAYRFACPKGASYHLAVERAEQLGMKDPVDIRDLPAGTVGWAGAKGVQGAYQQSTATTVGDLYVVAFVTSAKPLAGTYAAQLVTTGAAALAGFESGTRAVAEPAAPPSPPTITPTGADDICPPAGPSPAQATLDSLLPPTPSGFTERPAGDPYNGPIDLQGLAATAAVPDIAAALERSEGLRGADRRVWDRDADGSQLQVLVVLFSCPAGAARWFGPRTESDGSTPFAVTDGIAGARGSVVQALNSRGHHLEVIAASIGDAALEVEYYTPTTSTADIETLAADAAQHLASALGSN